MKKFPILHIMALSLALLAINSSAQIGGNDLLTIREQILNELDQTDQVIDRAKEAVRNSQSPRALMALEAAIKLQEAAKNKFNDANLLGYRAAGVLTRQAREKAKFALANGLFTEQNGEAVENKLERTDALLERAHSELGSLANDRLNAVLENAESNLKRAWEFYRDGRFLPALKLCNQVENSLKKILSVAARQSLKEGVFNRHLENLRALLDEVALLVENCRSESGRQLYEQAESSYQLAQELFLQNRPEAAFQALQNSRSLANRAREECVGKENLRQRYELLKSNADRIRETVPAANDSARKLMEQVYDQLALALDFIEAEQTEAAAASLKAAQLTLNEVIKLLNGSSSLN